MDRPLILYARVSTARQGRSGLGLQARLVQKQAGHSAPKNLSTKVEVSTCHSVISALGLNTGLFLVRRLDPPRGYLAARNPSRLSNLAGASRSAREPVHRTNGRGHDFGVQTRKVPRTLLR
jgi:hypothetical protein